MRKAPVFLSMAIHVGAVLLLVLLASIPAVRDSVAKLPDRVVPLFAPRRLPPIKEQGGGGQRSPLPASRGQAPPRPAAKVFVPPMAVRIENPRLMVQEATLDAPEITTSAQVGDPLGSIGPLSGGTGGPFGIGGGSGLGIGNGPGRGQGTASYKDLGITEGPVLLHSEEPEYSDEGRRAHREGTVVLAIDVDASGKVSNIRVLSSLGLGLDEKAKEAVLKWRFRPAKAKGRAVTAPAQVKVTFRLL
jgi:periplasmic protein TonB